jgi:hypothetical protein
MNDRMILFLGHEYLTGKAYIQTISTTATITTATTTTDDYCEDYDVIKAVTDILACNLVTYVKYNGKTT